MFRILMNGACSTDKRQDRRGLLYRSRCSLLKAVNGGILRLLGHFDDVGGIRGGADQANTKDSAPKEERCFAFGDAVTV